MTWCQQSHGGRKQLQLQLPSFSQQQVQLPQSPSTALCQVSLNCKGLFTSSTYRNLYVLVPCTLKTLFLMIYELSWCAGCEFTSVGIVWWKMHNCICSHTFMFSATLPTNEYKAKANIKGNPWLWLFTLWLFASIRFYVYNWNSIATYYCGIIFPHFAE